MKRGGSRDVVKMAAMLLPFLFLTPHLRAQSAVDGFDPNANGPIHVVVVQPDGKILVGGEFTALAPNGGESVARNYLARLNPDGTVDTAFDPNASCTQCGPPPGVNTIVVQADGKILVGGAFTSIGGQPRNYIARLDPTTGLADAFDPNASFIVQSIAVQADGRILAGGQFAGSNSIGGQTRNRIARLDPTTGLADSFDPNANNNVYSIAVQADGKILVGGVFHGIGGQPRNRIARLEASTGLADSFDPSPNTPSAVYSMAVQADGKILVGGAFTSIGGQTRNSIARLDAITGLADSFDPSPNASSGVQSIVVQADGRILVGGNFGTIGGETRPNIARLDANTGLADSFNPGANNAVFSIAVQADGKILAGGFFNGTNSIGGQTRNYIARLETDGRVDQTANPSVGGAGMTGTVIFATAIQPDGKILIGGNFLTVSGVTRNHIARLNTDGTLDMAFNPNANDSVASIVVRADGKILVGGDFTSIGGQPRNHIAQLDSTTALADSFDPNANGNVSSIAVQGDGKILVGGSFNGANSIGGQTRNYIARLDATSGLADSFDPNANSFLSSIVVQTDGKILAGGNFNYIGGQVRPGMARLDSTTALADSFNPAADDKVVCIAVQTDGKVLAGGYFRNIGGQPRRLMARLDPTTGLADSLDPIPGGGGPNRPIYSIVLQADGKILVGGSFEFLGGQHRPHIARLDASTGLADSFNPSADNQVVSMAVQADGKVLVGGYFQSMGGRLRNIFARLSADTAAQQNLAVTETTITWTRGGSSPHLTRVTFEHSTDNVNYTLLGHGTATGSDWTLTDLNLPIRQNFYIRARGYYRSGVGGASESVTESVRSVFIFRPSTLGNISTRLRVQTGDNAMIGGFIITGTEPKTVIVRGMGPSLSLPGALADPVIEVYGSLGQLLGTNDNWNDSLTRQQIIDSGLAPSNDLESALWGIINPGAYTVVVRGENGTTGIGLFEVYDLDPTADSKLANVSTRGVLETGDNVLIGGAIIVGSAPARVLVRAIGPSLTNLGVPNALQDPTLELYDGNGALIAVNYDWRDDQEAEIISTGIPPSNDLEPAIVRDFAPGNYTAIVRGLNNTTGMALVELYGLN